MDEVLKIALARPLAAISATAVEADAAVQPPIVGRADYALTLDRGSLLVTRVD